MASWRENSFFDPLRGNKAVDPIYRIFVELAQKGRLLRADRRGLPDFLVIGAMKAGTSSLLHYLFQHPRILPSIRKEVHYFDQHYNRPESWCRSHFPLRSQLKDGRITGEATPIYLFDPRVPPRILRHCPDAKLIVILRNPTERAISHYFFLKRKGHLDVSIEEHLARSDDLFRSAVEREDYRCAGFRHSLKQRGLYAEQLQRYFSLFRRDRMHILFSENLSTSPEAELKKVFAFLGVDESFLPGDLQPRNVAPFEKTVSSAIRAELDRFFAPHNMKLKDLLEEDIPW